LFLEAMGTEDEVLVSSFMVEGCWSSASGDKVSIFELLSAGATVE
jgi:hypothetical protein